MSDEQENVVSPLDKNASDKLGSRAVADTACTAVSRRQELWHSDTGQRTCQCQQAQSSQQSGCPTGQAISIGLFLHRYASACCWQYVADVSAETAIFQLCAHDHAEGVRVSVETCFFGFAWCVYPKSTHYDRKDGRDGFVKRHIECSGPSSTCNQSCN